MRKKRAEYVFNGRPCKYGHVGPRYKNGNCVTCLLERESEKQKDEQFAESKRQREKDRHWSDVEISRKALRVRRADNPEAFKEYARNSYTKHRDRRRSESRGYREKNIDAVKKRDREFHEKNKAVRNEKNRQWRAANPPDRDKARTYSALHYRMNKALYAMKRAGRRKMMREATPRWVKKRDLLLFYMTSERLTVETETPMSVDHIIPIKACVRGAGHVACGLNVPWNLRVITLEKNKKLGAYGWSAEGHSPLAFVEANTSSLTDWV